MVNREVNCVENIQDDRKSFDLIHQEHCYVKHIEEHNNYDCESTIKEDRVTIDNTVIADAADKRKFTCYKCGAGSSYYLQNIKQFV